MPGTWVKGLHQSHIAISPSFMTERLSVFPEPTRDQHIPCSISRFLRWPAWQRRRLRYKVTLWPAQATELPRWGHDSLTGGFQHVSCLVNTAWSSSRIVPWRHLPRQDTVSSTKKLLFSFSRHNSTFLSKYTLPRLRASPPGAGQHCCLLQPLSHLQSAAARVFSGN